MQSTVKNNMENNITSSPSINILVFKYATYFICIMIKLSTHTERIIRPITIILRWGKN